MNLTHLPQAIRHSVYFTSCTQICGALMEILTTSPRKSEAQVAKKVNIIGLHNFQQDLKALEEFAASSEVPQLDECFGSLSQLLKLVLTNDLERTLDQAYRFVVPYCNR